MRKYFSLLLILSSGLSFAEVLPLKGCSDANCDKSSLKELLSSTEQALYAFYNFSYNDSIYFEIKPSGDSVIIENTYAWVNEKALAYYEGVIKAQIDFSRLKKHYFYPITWVQKSKEESLIDLDEVKLLPVPEIAENFNARGQTAAYKYLYSNLLYNYLSDLNFAGNLDLELIMTNGKLTSIHYIFPPLEDKQCFKFAQYIKNIEKRFFSASKFRGTEDFKIRFTTISYSDDPDENPFDRLEFYINNNLWKPLKMITAGGHYQPGIAVELDTSEDRRQKQLYLFLEKELKAGRIKNSWWQIKPSNKSEKLIPVEDFISVGKVPIFRGCAKAEDNEVLQRCFQEEILAHVSSTFKYPVKSRQQGEEGMIYVNFVVEKNGVIDRIKIVRGATLLLDIESIRVVSELKTCTEPALLDDKPVPMSFTLPINAKLE